MQIYHFLFPCPIIRYIFHGFKIKKFISLDLKYYFFQYNHIKSLSFWENSHQFCVSLHSKIYLDRFTSKFVQMIKLFLIILGLVAVALILLSIRLFVGKKFIHTHVDGNRALNKKGIHCAQSQDRQLRRKRKTAINEHSSKTKNN